MSTPAERECPTCVGRGVYLTGKLCPACDGRGRGTWPRHRWAVVKATEWGMPVEWLCDRCGTHKSYKPGGEPGRSFRVRYYVPGEQTKRERERMHAPACAAEIAR